MVDSTYFSELPRARKKKHDAGNAKTILNQTSNFSLLTQSSGREDRLCPPWPIQEKLVGLRGNGVVEKKCKDFAKLLSRLKDWLSQLLSDQEDRKENSRGCLI